MCAGVGQATPGVGALVELASVAAPEHLVSTDRSCSRPHMPSHLHHWPFPTHRPLVRTQSSMLGES